MTREERERFVRDKIEEVWGISEVSTAIAEAIVDKWENDIEDIRAETSWSADSRME